MLVNAWAATVFYLSGAFPYNLQLQANGKHGRFDSERDVLHTQPVTPRLNMNRVKREHNMEV